jgi:hypothetical protein
MKKPSEILQEIEKRFFVVIEKENRLVTPVIKLKYQEVVKNVLTEAMDEQVRGSDINNEK